MKLNLLPFQCLFLISQSSIKYSWYDRLPAWTQKLSGYKSWLDLAWTHFHSQNVQQSLYLPGRALRVHRIRDNWHMKVVSLPALCTGRFNPQKIFLVLIFASVWVNPRVKLIKNFSCSESYVYWTVLHWNSWRIKDQLDVTCYLISLLMYSTCFGH